MVYGSNGRVFRGLPSEIYVYIGLAAAGPGPGERGSSLTLVKIQILCGKASERGEGEGGVGSYISHEQGLDHSQHPATWNLRSKTPPTKTHHTFIHCRNSVIPKQVHGMDTYVPSAGQDR